MWTKFVIIGIAIASFVSGDSIPFIQKCNAGDKKCQKESTVIALPIFAVGLPEYGVKPLDPVFVKEIDASSKNLKFLVTDVTLTGLKGCKPKKVHLAADKLSMRLLCDLILEGQYDISGQLLFLPINGKDKMLMNINHIFVPFGVETFGPWGPDARQLYKELSLRLIDVSGDPRAGAYLGQRISLTIQRESMQINIDSDVADKIGPDGRSYLDFKSWKHSYELKQKVALRFENLFQGNAVLGRAAVEVIDGSPNEIFNELAPPIVKHFFNIFVDQVTTFFKNVAKKDLINYE